MKVLIVCTVRFRMNGITSVIMNYYRNMDRTGMDFDFVVPNEVSSELRTELESTGARLFQIPRGKKAASYAVKLYRLMKENRYDVVHIHGNSASMLLETVPALLAGIPVRIIHAHTTSSSHPHMHKLLRPLLVASANHGFACGREAGEFLFGKTPFTVIENGVDLERFVYDAAVREEHRQKLGAGDRKVIGHVGNFFHEKNHTFLLDSFAELIRRDPGYLLVLISDGYLFEAMQQKCHDLGLDEHVLFLGKTGDVNRYMQAMDLFVLPSLHEGLPVVLVEAQAAGLPCLVADTVSPGANITGELKYLPIDDPAVWADGIGQAMKSRANEDRGERCGAWQKAVAAAGYDIRTNAHIMRELYREYLQKKDEKTC